MSSFVRTAPSSATTNAAFLAAASTNIPKGCTMGGTENLLTASGIPSLDAMFGGGFPLGGIACLREDKPRSTSNFASSILKCAISEGLQCGHYTLVFDGIYEDPYALFHALPSPIVKADEGTAKAADESSIEDEKMTIAWRYKHLRQLDDDGPGSSPSVGAPTRRFTKIRSFDLGKHLSEETIKGYSKLIKGISVFDENSIENFVKCAIELASQAKASGTILRVILRSFPSPLWNETDQSTAHFLYCLRRALAAYSENFIIFISLPLAILAAADIENQADLVIELQSFVGTPRETEKSLAEYSGFMRIVKLFRKPGMLSLILPECCDIAFKVKRRQLIFEPFHMPPDLEETTPSTVKKSSSTTCASGLDKSKLDF